MPITKTGRFNSSGRKQKLRRRHLWMKRISGLRIKTITGRLSTRNSRMRRMSYLESKNVGRKIARSNCKLIGLKLTRRKIS